jgi:hypothetical protein
MGLLLIDTLKKNKSVFNPEPGLDSSKYGIWDLTKSSITYNNLDIKIDDFFFVKDIYQMRPDLIAAIKLGDQAKVGSLLKINGISNPFALKEGRFILIPSDNTVERSFDIKKIKNQASTSSNTNTNPNEAFRKNQEQKKFKVSDGRKKFLASKVKNQPEMVLPPNVMQPSQRSILKKDGFLIFAPDAGGGGSNKPSN